MVIFLEGKNCILQVRVISHIAAYECMALKTPCLYKRELPENFSSFYYLCDAPPKFKGEQIVAAQTLGLFVDFIACLCLVLDFLNFSNKKEETMLIAT